MGLFNLVGMISGAVGIAVVARELDEQMFSFPLIPLKFRHLDIQQPAFPVWRHRCGRCFCLLLQLWQSKREASFAKKEPRVRHRAC